jgi:chorismate synthase
LYTHTDEFPGRVAAGAIAEKYLKTAYGIEIVAFVASVGKVHLPAAFVTHNHVLSDRDEDRDEGQEDAISAEYRNLIATVTREEVDKHPTRCPHPETAERMTAVCVLRIDLLSMAHVDIGTHSASSAPRRPKTQ